MSLSNHIIASLLVKRLQGELLDDAEDTVLKDWVALDPANAQFVLTASNEEKIIQWLKQHDVDVQREIDRRVLSRIKEQVVFEGEMVSIPFIAPAQRVHFLQTAWFRVAVAVILFSGMAAYFLLSQKESRPVLTETTHTIPQNDILPGTKRAILVLGDESVINLDSTANGVLSRQGESEVIKTADGELSYTGASKSINQDATVYFQKLITPRGGIYQITLPDGTQAWLNAESSIRFPNVFKENKRTVEITGEVYFEVKANKSKPFVVKTTQDEITVMGTRFNIHNYGRASSKTSLIDGAVKINETILQPGQAYSNGKIVTTDIQQDIAWENGYFNFNNLDLPIAMQQIERWYDVTIHYEGQIPSIRFRGKMQRDLTLQQMLKALEAMGVRFTLEGKNLTVKP